MKEESPINCLYFTRICEKLIHIYMATDLLKTQQNLESCEVLEAIELPLHQVQAMIRSGKIQDAKSIIGLELATGGGHKSE